MNEDLKKIKQHAYVLGGDEPETIGQQSAGIIIACAERMAAEIKRQREIIVNRTSERNTYFGGIGDLNREIASLKAELEKIVRCGECKWEDECLGMRLGTWGEHHEIDFCSNGQRKSEEGK